MIANASSRDSPWPKNAGAEPIPPKLPQPRTSRETSMPVPPSARRSTRGRLAHVSTTVIDIEAVRARFSSLRGGFAFFDAPRGSQVPDEVGEAISRALAEASGNLGAPYETGRRVEAILMGARAAAGRFLGCSPDEVVFGANMTTLNFALTRTASRDWSEGDRILCTRLDHDGNVAPWLELAADRGLHVDLVDVTVE